MCTKLLRRSGARPVLLLGTFLLGACVPQVAKISSRNPDLFEKESDHLAGRSRGTDDLAAPDLFIKQKQVTIQDQDRPNTTGSLFNPDDERNYLYTPTGPLNVGRFLTIKVAVNRSTGDKKKDEAREKERAKSKEGKGGKDAKDAKDGKDAKGDEVEAELLKALPELAPSDKEREETALLRSFKMQILHRFANGDVLAMTTRRSRNGDQAREISVEARIPYDRLASGDELTTDDLLDVKLHESRGAEVAERNSSSWEDEYSLRLSGFDEAKSKAALELGEQKKKLAEAEGKLESKIKTFGEERRQVAKQREDLGKQKVANEEKVQDLEGKVKEQQDTIEKQETEIKDLSPEDKPSDGKEGGNG